MSEELKPCPFCRGGETVVDETYMPPQMNGKRLLVSVAVRHWCARPPGIVSARVEFRGRTRADAINGWNRRDDSMPTPGDYGPDYDIG